MLVKLLLILLIIRPSTQETYYDNYDSTVGKETVRFFEHICKQLTIGTGEFYHELITINFNSLKKYQTKMKQFENIKFNEVKVYPLKWDRIKEKSLGMSKMCGLGLGPAVIKTEFLSNGRRETVNVKNNYEISYSTGYYEGHNFDDYLKAVVYCNIQQCDMGLFFFDKFKNAEILNNVKQIHTVDYVVLMVIESKDNKMLLGIRPHHKVDIKIGLCPYIRWVPEKGLYKFIPEDHIKDNGYVEKENRFAHIVVPFYKKNGDSNEFICGKFKQLQFPDIHIGYTLREDIGNKQISRYINPLHDELKCNYLGPISSHYHFGYMETNTNYMSERIMEPIKVRENDTTYNFYAGQLIYIYNWEKFEFAFKNKNKHERLRDPNVIEEVSCIKELKSDIKAYILPTIGSVETIKKHEGKNIFYRLVKSDELDNKYLFRCLTKTVEANKGHMEEFYSRSAEFMIKNEEDPNVVYTSTQNEINFKRKKINNYGSYRCKDVKTTPLFRKEIVTLDMVYYLPDENAEMEFVESHVDDTYQSDIGCNKQYGTFGSLKKMTIKFGENVRDPINIDDFSNSTDTIEIKEGKILYKVPKDIPGVTVICVYETPVETTFYTTKDTFISISQDSETRNNATNVITKEKIVKQVKNNSTPWVIGIVIAVILFCIIVIVVAYLIIRRIRKRRAEDSLSSYSGLSTLSKSRSKGSSSMSSSKSKTRSGSRSASMSNASKTAKGGKGSRAATYSSNVTSNVSRNSKSSTSTNRGKNYFKNVKLTAK
uniref:6-cysteine protein n=1 Tax=Strongyloides venezuelensis TaxID=75913 RepID=A0A0K0G4A8_STRVS